MSLSPKEITQKLKAGDRKVFEELFRMHYTELCLFARKYTNDMEKGEELVQDLFVRLWDKRETMEFNTSVKSYLYTSLKNTCLNYLKHLKVREKYQQHVMREYKESNHHLHDPMVEPDFELRVYKAIDELPRQCREIFKMSRFEGLKYREIADHLGVSIKTVENQIGKALRLLRVELKDLMALLILCSTW
ncbi:RNA polymerase sigma-70 factor [Roseivirga sp. BDSF3-8]|uniref:RNA polymerase sigma-70 factor n=1 Tax=Roseivirga sp. BDSF3-8 TaxID=3241598 RepID=UPI0035326E5E